MYMYIYKYIPPRNKNKCILKRDHSKRKNCLNQPSKCSGDMFCFQWGFCWCSPGNLYQLIPLLPVGLFDEDSWISWSDFFREINIKFPGWYWTFLPLCPQKDNKTKTTRQSRPGALFADVMLSLKLISWGILMSSASWPSNKSIWRQCIALYKAGSVDIGGRIEGCQRRVHWLVGDLESFW